MGRRSRHSAKTGDQKLYKSRSDETSNIKNDGSDDDPMYNEVERYHNRKEAENYLELDGHSDDDGSDSSEDDGITKHQEGVFDLGMGGSSDDDEDEEDEDSQDEAERAAQRATRQRAAAIESALASSDEDDSDSDDEDEGAAINKSSQLLNWGDKKHAYYHGDTADLEIGQDVEDAYLEEEAGREVEKARLDGMDDADFMLDGHEGEEDAESEAEEPSRSKKSKKKSSSRDGAGSDGIETMITHTKRSSKQLSKLSKKEKLKLLKANHPELLPLVSHFEGPVQELSETTMVAAGALLKNGVAKGGKEAEAVGATTAGLQYLITKSMLQASKALNLSLYLLLKSDQASNSNNIDADLALMDDDEGDDIRNHPVMDRLNQLSQLTDKLQEGVEDKVPGLKEQMTSLVKAAALMAGGDISSDESDGDSDDGTESSEVQDAQDVAAMASDEEIASDNDEGDDAESSSSDSEDERENQEAIQRRIMTEAKFALRNQDIDHDTKKSKKRKRRAAPTTSDYGDETEEVTEKSIAASRNLASTMNAINQKSSTVDNRKNKSVGDEDGDEDEYADLSRGLAMMEEEFGKGSDEDGMGGDDNDEEGLGDSDEDDFYKAIKKKSKAKRDAKKQMYAVAPKYPRMEGVVEGERAIGRTIMQNRGLVPHKAKINRNPRVKKREQYRKALIRRKGAVREIRTDEGHVYAGESTGIKSGISRSRKLK